MRKRLFQGLQAAVIVLAGLWVFWPAMRGGWIWDDLGEIVQHPVLLDPHGAWKAWVAPADQDYFPLKTTVQWVEWRMWGQDPLGYHLTSLALHLASALLFWRLLLKLRRGIGSDADPSLPDRRLPLRRQTGDGEAGPRVGVEWLGGLLFVVHPLAVESVAWIAELKNTLSLPILLVAMIAYVDFDRTGRRGFYALSLIGFLLAVLAKSSVVMFPFVILLYLWWRRGKIGRRDLFGTAPFFVAALALGLVTIWFQRERAIEGADLAIGGLGSRLEGAGLAIVFYLWKFIAPIGLMPIYPRWEVVPAELSRFWPWLALGAVAGWLWTKRSGWGRDALFGLGFFAVNLVPVLGLIPMAYLRISWVADHFVYLPMLGLIGVVAGGGSTLAKWMAAKRRDLLGPLAAAAAALLAALGVASHRYAETYRDGQSFWTHGVRQNPKAWLAHNELGLILTDAGRMPEAVGHLEAALKLRPAYAEAHNNLGNALARSGRLPEALAQFNEATRLNPRMAAPHANLGNALLQSGRLPEAIDEFERALKLMPDYPEVHNSLGEALALSGRLPEAIAHFEEAVRLEPNYAEAHSNLGNALGQSGRLSEAVGEFQVALKLRPDFETARRNLDAALRALGRAPQSEEQIDAAATHR